MNYALASAILKGKWAIDPSFAINALQTIVPGILANNPVSPIDKTSFEPIIYSPSAADSLRMGKWSSLDGAPDGSVAIIPLKGALMKDDQECGPVGMATLGNYFMRAEKASNISAIVLHVDSPGGTVDGTSDLANIIAASTKPVVTFVDGLMASAALWIGLQAKEVFASNNFAEVGSVGVMMSFMDVIPAYEKKGAKYHQIVSTLSPDKVKMYNDLRAGNYDDYRKFQLDPLAEEFHRVVKTVRPSVTEDLLTGSVFFSKDVMGKFVDKIGTLQDAIDRAAELSRQKSQPASISKPSNNKKSSAMKNYALIVALLGVASLEADSEGFISLNAEQLDSIEAALANLDKAKADLTAANDNLASVTTERDSARTSLTDITAKHDTAAAALVTANETIAELRKRVPGAEGAQHHGKAEGAETELTAEAEQALLKNMSIADRKAYLEKRDSKN